MLKVVGKFVDELKMALTLKNVELSVTPETLKWLLKKGYDRAYGARPLARTVDEHIKKALVDELLFGKLSDGGRVQVDVENQGLKFQFTSTSTLSGSQKNKKEKITTES